MPLYDFKCRVCNEITESFASVETKTMECICGEIAQRIISRVNLKIPVSSDKWAKMHEAGARKG